MDEQPKADADLYDDVHRRFMNLSIEERVEVLLKLVLENDQLMIERVAELEDQYNTIAQHINEIASYLNVQRGKPADLKAFRKHLNQGYAMLKRLEEAEAAK